MAMVAVDDSSLHADSQPKSGGFYFIFILNCGSAAAWRCSTFTRRTELTLVMTSGHDDSTINIVVVIIIIIIIIISFYWRHVTHGRGH